ncbi:uncharacterized protein B0H64DRAFT_171562 [Chaetomium fimeti]|uniref:Uncharacterized protein n=1 Tax=Chaetomium fimeti TaxID=1854472 RepID=A0AAE0HHP3_9PEZI|nr:hypothetical protein B0H64DRAFT_171562 [Chaetomium fimeti]
MANNQLSQVEVAARGMDLLTAIFNSPGSRVVANIARWLGREGVDEEELGLCLEQSAGLVYGNDNCEDFYKTVTLQPPITKIAKDFVSQGTSGSLGGQMAAHPHLRWLTSTVAGLFQFHSEHFIHATILAFIIQANQNPGELLSETKAKHDTRGVTMKRVLRKLVDSVWFYVVNSATARSGISNVLPLPNGLDDVCENGHYLKAFELGSCLARIRTAVQNGGEIVIESMYLIKDLIWWLWYHFTGNLTVVVGGKILEDKPGESAEGVALSRIEVRIRKSCPRGTCDTLADPRSSENIVRVRVAVAGKAQDLFETTTYNCGDPLLWDRGAAVRTELYDVPFTRRRDREIPSVDYETLGIRTRATAVIIVSRLLDLPVSGTFNRLPSLAFAVQVKPEDKKGPRESRRTLRVMDLVTRSPSILNMGWDCPEKNTAAVFEAPPRGRRGGAFYINGARVPELPTQRREHFSTTDVEASLCCYPILKDLADSVREVCKCMWCRRRNPDSRLVGRAIFDKGCLRRKVFMGVLQLVAHAIADCFGCEDASPLPPDAEDLGVLDILSAVIHGVVIWNDWFAVASRVFLGCPDLIETQSPEDAYQRPRLAIQYGGLATLAPWLDMSADLRSIKPFSMQRVKGRIGVLRGDGTSEAGGVSIQSVEGSFAMIESRHTEAIESQGDRVQGSTEGATPECVAPSDPHTTLETDMILVPEEKSRYELWLRVRTKQHSRLIDPSSAIRALSRLLGIQDRCLHLVDETSQPGDRIAGAVQAGSFDQVLGTWGSESSLSRSITSVQDIFCGLSPVCDSHLRLNITASLTLPHEKLLACEKACVVCRSKEKDAIVEMMNRSGRNVVSTSAFVIYVSKHVLEGRHHAGAPIEWGHGHNSVTGM